MKNESQNTNRTLLRLEQKLIELGYKQDLTYKHLYLKNIDDARILLWLNNSRSKITKDSGVLKNESIYVRKQEDINALQQAFNEMEKDLEELKNVENK